MSDSQKYSLGEIPKNGRIDSYLKECLEIIKEQGIDIPKLEKFMFEVFNDCKTYLKEHFNLNFPNMQLVIIYKKEEYAELLKKLDETFGARPYTKAVCVVTKGMSWIYIDFLSHFKGTRIDFIANLSVSFIEELVHSAVYPNKSETDVHELVCSAIEGFLEVKLPDTVREARLKYARKIDGY
jgi:hypothetical protein